MSKILPTSQFAVALARLSCIFHEMFSYLALHIKVYSLQATTYSSVVFCEYKLLNCKLYSALC